MTKVRLCYIQYMLVTNNTGSPFVSRSLAGSLNCCGNSSVWAASRQFWEALDFVRRYVKEIILQNHSGSHRSWKINRKCIKSFEILGGMELQNTFGPDRWPPPQEAHPTKTFILGQVCRHYHCNDVHRRLFFISRAVIDYCGTSAHWCKLKGIR